MKFLQVLATAAVVIQTNALNIEAPDSPRLMHKKSKTKLEYDIFEAIVPDK